MKRFFKTSILTLSLVMGFAAASQAATKDASVCALYNQYVDSQCVDASEMAADLDAEILNTYSAARCRTESLQMILETDEAAKSSCTLSKSEKNQSILARK